MGPITKKVNQLLSTEGLSDETIRVLEDLKREIQPIERRVINESYNQGYSDKEMGRRPTWAHYENRYECGILKMFDRQSK